MNIEVYFKDDDMKSIELDKVVRHSIQENGFLLIEHEAEKKTADTIKTYVSLAQVLYFEIR